MWILKELKQLEILFPSIEVSYPFVLVYPSSLHPDFTVHFHLHDLYPHELPNISFDGIPQSDAITLFHQMSSQCQRGKPMLKSLITIAQSYHRSSSKLAEAEGKLRTAGDVISRVQWDPTFRREAFKVGYLDRFEGLKTITFDEVDWEDPPFPQHRIQYFSFDEIIIWDKRIALDFIFGSRPPSFTFHQLMERLRVAQQVLSSSRILDEVCSEATHMISLAVNSQDFLKKQDFAGETPEVVWVVLAVVWTELDLELKELLQSKEQDFCSEITLPLDLNLGQFPDEEQTSVAVKDCVGVQNLVSSVNSTLSVHGVTLLDPESFPRLVIPKESMESPVRGGVELQLVSRFSGRHQLSTGGSKETEDLSCEFVGVFLTAKHRVQLVRKWNPVHGKVKGDVVVCWKNPVLSEILHDLPPLGSTIRMTVKWIFQDAQYHGIFISFTSKHRSLLRSAHQPYLILSHTPDASMSEFKGRTESLDLEKVHGMELEGILGVQTRARGCSRGRKVISEDFLRPQIPKEISQKSPQIVFSTSEKITELLVFDFDGTLVSSPGDSDGRKEYQDQLGFPFPFVGFYGRKESLMDPMRILPGPAMLDYFQYLARPGIKTVVLTGRLLRLQKIVKEVLRKYGVQPDLLTCKQSAEDVQEFKISVLRRLLREHPDVQLVRVWEDNLENLAQLYSFRKKLYEVEMEIYEAPNLPTPAYSSQETFSWEERDSMVGLSAFLAAAGKLKDSLFDGLVECGLDWVKNIWSRLVQPSFYFLTGNYALGRKSEVEVCLLAPNNLSHEQCFAIMIDQLEQEEARVEFLQGKTPDHPSKLRLTLYFEDAQSLTFNIAFCRVHNDLHGLDSLSMEDMMMSLEVEDEFSRELIERWKFVEEWKKSLTSKELEQWIVILEMMALILNTNTIHLELKDMLILLQRFHKDSEVNGYPTSDKAAIGFLLWMAQLHDKDFPDSKDGISWKEEDWSKILRVMENCKRFIDQDNGACHWTFVYDILLKKLS